MKRYRIPKGTPIDRCVRDVRSYRARLNDEFAQEWQEFVTTKEVTLTDDDLADAQTDIHYVLYFAVNDPNWCEFQVMIENVDIKE